MYETYYLLCTALTSILRNQFCYCPQFIVEIGAQEVKPLIKATELVNNRTESKSGCCQRSNALRYLASLVKGFKKQRTPDLIKFSEQTP